MIKRIDLIAGARPNFMKIAPIIDALNAAKSRGSNLRFRLIAGRADRRHHGEL